MLSNFSWLTVTYCVKFVDVEVVDKLSSNFIVAIGNSVSSVIYLGHVYVTEPRFEWKFSLDT